MSIKNKSFRFDKGAELDRNQLIRDLVSIQFERNDIDFQRGRFRVRGDVVEIFPASRDERALRVEFLEMKSNVSEKSTR